MEPQPLLHLLLLILSFFALKIIKALWWNPRKIQHHFSKQGVRGPPYRFFIGNVKELAALMSIASSQPLPLFSHNILPRVLSFYHHWNKIYGATFLVWFGTTARLTVSDPELIREIFTTRAESYEKTDTHPLVKQLEGNGLLSLKGEKWSHHRKIINPTFHMENLKLLIPVMAKSVAEMLDKWCNMSDSGETEIEVSEWFQTLTEDVVTRTVFGSSYIDGKAIFQLQAEQMLYAAESFQKVFIPGYRFIPTKKNMNSWKLDKEIRRLLVKLIDERSENLGNEMKGDFNGGKDLLGLMIRASQREKAGGQMSHEVRRLLASSSSSSSSSAAEITYSDIIEECKTFFFAGKQTTSSLLTWTTILLAMHPHWQTLARDEVLKVCGSRRLPSKDDLPKLKLLSMIVNESLRLYPPTVATIRRAKADVELGAYKVPSGTELLIPILAVHHDKASWGTDANDFNPSRFANGANRAANHPMAFMPFGVGARSCIGQNLATLQAKIAIAVILQKCNLRLSPSYQHAPSVLLMLYPQHGAPVIFQRLKSNDVPL
ncbi:unnamed protein product [Rhodiola kirilowii]